MAYNSRAFPQNIAVLDRLAAKRYEVANLLGFKTWADYATADKMIKSAKNASGIHHEDRRRVQGPGRPRISGTARPQTQGRPPRDGSQPLGKCVLRRDSAEGKIRLRLAKPAAVSDI
jgi:hypothetical protein